MRTEAVLPESELRTRVQQRIEDGRLPVKFVTLVNDGFDAAGHVCPVCDQPVKRDKVEYDVDLRNANYHLTFHYPCYVIWQRECARRIRVERADLGDRER